LAAYWSAGGSVVSRRGPLSDAAAAERLAFYRDAGATYADPAALQFCCARADELAAAIAQAARWRRCGGAPGRPPSSRER